MAGSFAYPSSTTGDSEGRYTGGRQREFYKRCSTDGCDRVAPVGLDRCGTCTVAYMDGARERGPLKIATTKRPR